MLLSKRQDPSNVLQRVELTTLNIYCTVTTRCIVHMQKGLRSMSGGMLPDEPSVRPYILRNRAVT